MLFWKVAFTFSSCVKKIKEKPSAMTLIVVINAHIDLLGLFFYFYFLIIYIYSLLLVITRPFNLFWYKFKILSVSHII